MSKHQEWKMIHLLYRYAYRKDGGNRLVLTEDELTRAGVHCGQDTHQPMEDAEIVNRTGNEFELSKPAREIIRRFTVAKSPNDNIDLRIDYPEVFVVMPFSECWSDDVFTKMLEPGIKQANFMPIRGDLIVRIGDLSDNLWQSITQAGVIIAEVSAPNPNVYYEIGLAEALGKPIFLFKQEHIKLPADFGGSHYYTYDLKNLQAGRQKVTAELTKWAQHEDHQPFGVKILADR